ncbi:MAG: adenylosuccinate synthase, partial [Bacteroidales bacterium]|nr:adenylosuccinate synthase [Bacteroidales bacterium]
PPDELVNSLIFSSRANLILPGRRILDAAYENARGDSRIGSTLRGIGPAYTDKVARNGLRAGDIASTPFRELYNERFRNHMSILKDHDFSFDPEEYEADWFEGLEIMKKFRIVNTEYLVNDLVSKGRKILAEGAQGTMLDIDFGTYPFVTSSSTVSAGACTGLGISPGNIGEVFGIFKAYCTRVGSGPFPTELTDDTGDTLRNKGNEFGSTTGRPRRCGWLDLPALKYAIMINGITRLFMTKSDVMSGFDNIRVCTSYLSDGREYKEVPFDSGKIKPVYSVLPGWMDEISEIRDFNDLPVNLKAYIEFIENHTGVPVTLVSVGPDRRETIFRQ